MTKHIIQGRFSNVQLEILKLFTEDLPEEDLLVIRDMLSAYRFKRASEAASKATKAKGWTADDFGKLLHTHLRTPYKQPYSPKAKPNT